ncbi:MAG: DNA-directed RNA polymerase subunit omega [Clostridiales bacterium]|jgi:DNA-directed RNA polymerase omega subunit|nr:DNA-directed RNA polymerase subunit omega [Clostridiales bacterium]
MLVDPSVEELLPKAECRFSLCMLVAKRARQLVDGAQPMVDDPTPSYVTLACKEVAADKVVGVEGIHTPYVPLRPEIEEARRLAKEAAENQARMDAEQAMEAQGEEGETAMEDAGSAPEVETVNTDDLIEELSEEEFAAQEIVESDEDADIDEDGEES